MKLVRGRADARLLPSRHAYAFFRLIAFLRLSRAKPQPANVTIVIDRYQSAAGVFFVAAWYALTFICFVAALLPWSWPIAIAVAIPLSLVLIQVPLYVIGLAVAPIFVRNENRQRFMSIALLLVVVAPAAYFATRETWVRFAAWQVFGVLAINAIAAVILFLLRGRIAKLEEKVTTCAQ